MRLPVKVAVFLLNQVKKQFNIIAIISICFIFAAVNLLLFFKRTTIMEEKFFAVKEKLNNAAACCSIDSFISECCIWNNGVGYLDLNVSPIPYSFFELIRDFVEVVSISFGAKGLRIGFVCL